LRQPVGLPPIRVQRRRLADVLCGGGDGDGRPFGEERLGRIEGMGGSGAGGKGGKAADGAFPGRAYPLLTPLQLLSPLALSPYPPCSPGWEQSALLGAAVALLRSPPALPPSPVVALPSLVGGNDDAAAAAAAPATGRAKGLEGEVAAAAAEAGAAPVGFTVSSMLAGRKRVRAPAERLLTGTTSFLSGGSSAATPLPPMPSAAGPPSSYNASLAATSLPPIPSYVGTPSRLLPPSTPMCVRALVADGATAGGVGVGLVGALLNDLPQQLERCGFDVVTAATVTEAVGRFEEAVGGWAAVVPEVCDGSGKDDREDDRGKDRGEDRGKDRGEDRGTNSGKNMGEDSGEVEGGEQQHARCAGEQCALSEAGLASDAAEAGGKADGPFSLVVMELEAMAHDGFACIRSIRRAEGQREGGKGRDGEECTAADARCNQLPVSAPGGSFSGIEADTNESSSSPAAAAAAATCAAAAAEEAPGSVSPLEDPARAANSVPRTVIIAVANMNRWDLAGLDRAMQQSMHAGVDAVVPRTMNLQQLKSVLRKLGVRGKYVLVPSSLPRAMSGTVHNPLNMSR
ncbi:hypothetical protein CLOP_g16692, partial [Closterium sp. NIES-67]